MIQKAKDTGLAIDDKVEKHHPLEPDPKGKIYRSKKGFYRFTKGYDREIGISEKRVRDEGVTEQGNDPTQSVHQSALDRWDLDSSYRPPELVKYLKKINDKRVSSG